MSLNFASMDAFAATQFQGQQLLLAQDEKKADIAVRQQQAQALQMSNLMQKQQLQDKQALQQFMTSEQQTAAAPVQTATEKAKLYGKAAAFSMQRGDFDDAAAMEKLAKGETETAQKEQILLEKQHADDSQALSVAAQDASANPTPDNAKRLFNAAIKAGITPDQIPMPGTPKYEAFLNQSSLAGLKGDERVKFLEQVKEKEAAAKALAEQRKMEHEDREAARADRAQAREESRADRKEAMALRETLAKSLIESREAKTASQEAGGAIQHRNTIAAVNYANEVARGLDLTSKLPAGTTNGVFAHLGSPDTILKSLESTGTNKITPEIQQMLQTANKGLGLELAQLMTAGSGRAPNKDVISEMGKMVTVEPGDKEYTAMFKFANAADLALTRLKAVPKSSDPNIQKTREEAEKKLAAYPNPAIVAAEALKHGVHVTQEKSMREKLDGLMQKHDAEAARTAVPADIQSILNLYPSK